MTKKAKIMTLNSIKNLFFNVYNMTDDDIIFENDALWIWDDCCITYETNDDLSISFNLESNPTMVANFIKTLLINGFNPEIYEGFWFDIDNIMHWESDSIDSNSSLFIN